MDTSVKEMLIRRVALQHPDNKTVPSQHEAMSNLGFFLGETILNEMSPIAKEMMGIGTPFPVAPKTVWLTPSDRIDGNIVLKPPPNEDVIKALTHEGILEIGSTVEQRLEKHWQAKIKAAQKEVEDFERFECKNRIQFALQQEKQAHEAALKQQRVDLLKMFQKDREELIEDSKTELETLKKNLDNENKMKTEIEVKLSCKEIERSSNDQINTLTEQNNLLESEIEEMEKMVHVKVEKRKSQDWQILHEMFVEMHRQFTAKLQFLHHQHNAEIRQLYLELKTKTADSEQTTCYNEDSSLWEEGSLNSELEQEKIEFNAEDKPFVINVCKVDGESSEENQEDDHSTGSSFKCYKHRSKPKSENYEVQFPRGLFESQIFNTDTLATGIADLNDINTTDVSCNILRRLGLNFNVANIEKVKIEVDNLLINVNKRGETKLLTVIDSLDLIGPESTNNILGSKESLSKQEPVDRDREEYKRLLNRRKSQKVIDSKLAIPLTVEEYMDTFTPIPKYMTTGKASISIWDYKTMNDEEWNNLLEEIDNKFRVESTESNSKNKTVTMTSRNSMDPLVASEKILSNDTKKPLCGILRSSVESKNDDESWLKNEVFNTDQMQSLVGKLAD